MILLDKTANEPLYLQIYQQIKEEILTGGLNEGDCLTGSRAAAKLLNVSRHTVDTAYSQLAAEGYIAAKIGLGFFVQPVPSLPNLPSINNNKQVSPTIRRIEQQKSNDTEILYDLTNSSHTSNLFPKKIWQRYTAECLEKLYIEEKISTLQDKQGELFLRESLSRYLQRMRGVHCHLDQIILTSGTQQSLDFLCKLLSTSALPVLMEEPGYNKAVSVFRNNGRNIQTVPVDEQGICVQKLPVVPENTLLYTTPSHQFPTGVTLPVGRRHELLNWACKNSSYIIEDDYDSELRYYAKPIPALQSIDTHDRVIYLGTFSKVLSPSLRMSYMILPPQLAGEYRRMFADYNSTVPLLNQYIVATLIDEGKYDQHVRRLNQIFKKRLKVFTELLAGVSDNLKISSNGSGQYFLLTFTAGTQQDELIEAAAKEGVRVYSTMNFWQEKAICPPNTLFLGFSKIELADIPDCAHRLKVAWKKWL
ncbi:PLP-dependent aminotransferase family protein [Enterococcus larvae]|uniref:MocR-like pyridoxine biosynthesis transcription factor PdxR n=1 Tax=Enterococcus larvae TaxID=2794352 RepID=UPI003F40660B